MDEVYGDYLIHFGVKGMKWGVRKDTYKKADRATKKKYKEVYKKTDEYKIAKRARQIKRSAFLNATIPFANVHNARSRSFSKAIKEIMKEYPKAGILNSHLLAYSTPEYHKAFDKGFKSGTIAKYIGVGATTIAELGFILGGSYYLSHK